MPDPRQDNRAGAPSTDMVLNFLRELSNITYETSEVLGSQHCCRVHPPCTTLGGPFPSSLYRASLLTSNKKNSGKVMGHHFQGRLQSQWPPSSPHSFSAASERPTGGAGLSCRRHGRGLKWVAPSGALGEAPSQHLTAGLWVLSQRTIRPP